MEDEDGNVDAKLVLIEEVKRRPYLWNTDDENYKQMWMRNSGWLDVAEGLCNIDSKTYTVGRVQKMWRSLRDRARKIDRIRRRKLAAALVVRRRRGDEESGEPVAVDDAERIDDGEQHGLEAEKWAYWAPIQFIFEKNLPPQSGHQSGLRTTSTAARRQPQQQLPQVSSVSSGGGASISYHHRRYHQQHNSNPVVVVEPEQVFLVHEHDYQHQQQQHHHDDEERVVVVEEPPSSHSSQHQQQQQNTRPAEAVMWRNGSDNRKRKRGEQQHHLDTSADQQSAAADDNTPRRGNRSIIGASYVDEEYAIFGASVAETLNRASSANQHRAKQCKLAIMRLLVDLEADLL